MADRRVRYVLEVDYEGKSVLLDAADDLRGVDDAARQAGEGLGEAEGGFSKLQANIVTAQAALGMVQQGFQMVSGAVQVAWGALEEGAAAQDAREDFDALAESVGTTADVMLTRMDEAAGGMLTNMELIDAASDLMLLNLGLNEDQITDLVGVAGELEWSMDALANTLNTKSTRGLKELGLGIEDVQGRVEELTAQGYELDEAFTLAILDAGRERIELVGGASETAAGQMVIATNALHDYTTELKENAVVSLQAFGFFDALAREAEEMGAASGIRKMIDEYEKLTGLRWETPGGLANMDMAELEAEALRLEQALTMLALAESSSADATRDFNEAQEEAIAASAEAADAVMLGAQARKEYAEDQEWNARAAEWMSDAQHRAAAADYERATSVEELAAKQDLATDAAKRWAEITAELTATGGDYFTQFSQAGPDAWNFADALYAAADAAGAGVGPLSEIAVQQGLMTQTQADAFEALTQQQMIIDSLAGAAAAGKIAWEDLGGVAQHTIDVLNGAYLIDLGPREMPEMDDRGFRQEYQEMFENYTREESPWVVTLEAENQAVLDAVAVAEGAVNGFTSPEEIYQAVMGMDISEVEEKTGRATELINGIPDYKSFTLDITVRGMELLEELRAAGVIN